jgi:hypothetical protein
LPTLEDFIEFRDRTGLHHLEEFPWEIGCDEGVVFSCRIFKNSDGISNFSKD